MKKKVVAVLIAAVMVMGLVTACGNSGAAESAEPAAEEEQAEAEEAETEDGDAETEALVIDEDAKTVTIQAVATGNTESGVHLLVNADGGNSDKAFFTSEATTLDFYNALAGLGAVPGNNIAVEDETGTILGSDLDVKVIVDGTEYSPYDLIDASEKREMKARFGGNLAANQEYGTGCLLCMESCSLGITSDSAYQYQEPMDFVPSDQMPEAGTEVAFVFTVDDTAMVVNEEAGTISINAVATGYSDSTIHAIVSDEGSNAEKAFFTTAATTQDYYDALKQLGAEDGNNIAVDDADGTIEGSAIEVTVEQGTDSYPFADLFTASDERAMDMRFGGNIDNNLEFGTGCLMCLESCPAGISSDAAYQYQEDITFGPSDKMPAAGSHVIITFAVK